jgi:chemotaxis protein CheZ
VSDGNGDNPELEELFDSIAGSYGQQPIEGEATVVEETREEAPAAGAEDVYSQIGHLTRKLHETLRQLGYDKSLEDAVSAMPDTRERLTYIATLTEKAAERVLNATERAKPIQEKLGAEAKALAQQWQRVFDNQMSVDEFKALAHKTRDYLAAVPAQTDATNAELMEIMMAQDFQDLTGQVIKKVIALAQDLENQLLQVLLASTPPEKRKNLGDDLLNGPVVNASGRSDVVTNQAQVDDLLASLGF